MDSVVKRVTDRIERLRLNDVNTRPSVCYERAKIHTDLRKRTEGKAVILRRAQAFYDFCGGFEVRIFSDELIE